MSVGQGGQTGQNVTKVGHGVDAAPAAALYDGIEDGAALTRFCSGKEQIVFSTKGREADSVFEETIICLEATIVEEDAEFGR